MDVEFKITDKDIVSDIETVEQRIKEIKVIYNQVNNEEITSGPAIIPSEHYEIKRDETTKRLSLPGENISDVRRSSNGQNFASASEPQSSGYEEVLRFPGASDGFILSVPDIQWPSVPPTHYVKKNGLDILNEVNTLNIQQTVELCDLMAKIESTNRYLIKVPEGNTMFIASEMSTSLQRMFCGAGRAFTMRLHDQSREDMLILSRRLAGASCWFPCRLQAMQVATPEAYLGRINQQWTWFVPFFLIRDSTEKVIYLIQGPSKMRPCCYNGNLQFDIINAQTLEIEGSITNKWDTEAVNYSLDINFPIDEHNVIHKALIIAAAFLLEYTYFERAKSKSCSLIC